MTPSDLPILPEIPEAAHFSGVFYAGLDCDLCGSPFQVEGDVSNGEIVRCDGCGKEMKVYGR